MFRGPLTVLVARLGTVAALFMAQRLLFYWSNAAGFPDPSLWAFLGGIRFDLSAIGWIFLPWVLVFVVHPFPTGYFKRFQVGLFLLLAALSFFFNCVDIAYYHFTLRRSTADLLDIMGAGGDVFRLMPVFLRDYWYIALIFVASLWVAFRGYRWAGKLGQPSVKLAWRIGWRAVALAMMALMGRGGTQLIPLGVLHAGNYAAPTHFPLVLNTPFTIMTSLGKPVVQERVYMPKEQADALWPVEHHFADTLHTVADRPNVVVLLLESFSAEYSGYLHGGTGYMPFLDSLMQQGLCFSRAYANGRRSIDAVPAVFASIPELMDEAFVASPYAETPFTSLPGLLNAEGYHSLFLHGGNNGTMSFDVFAKAAGFQQYLGRNEYTGPETDIDVWGVRDRPYLAYCVDVLSRTPEPFMAGVFTLSSHHPYTLPEPDATRFAPGTTQPIHATLRYADDALRNFFARAARTEWGANTLFILTADHTADLLADGKINSSARDYWVPLVYYMPERIAPRKEGRVTQQIDILPTTMDLIGYSKPFFSFGQSALRSDAPAYSATARDHVYLLFGEDRELFFDGDRTLLTQAIVLPAPDTVIIDAQRIEDDMQLRIQAIVQQFTTRLVERRLTISDELE